MVEPVALGNYGNAYQAHFRLSTGGHMSIFSSSFSGRFVAFACAVMFGTGAASATVLFSESFSQAQTNGTDASYGVGLIDNTGFFVSSGTIDIGGSLNTTFGAAFACGHNPGGNCIHLIGATLGSITTVNSFSLLAGQTYTISMGATLLGGLFAPPADFTVKLANSPTLVSPCFPPTCRIQPSAACSAPTSRH